MCWCVEEMLLEMNFQQLLQWQVSGRSAGSPEEDRFHSGRRRRGASVAAGSDWSLHSTEEGLLEQRASEKTRTDTVYLQTYEVAVETLILITYYQSFYLTNLVTLHLTSTSMTRAFTLGF